MFCMKCNSTRTSSEHNHFPFSYAYCATALTNTATVDLNVSNQRLPSCQNTMSSQKNKSCIPPFNTIFPPPPSFISLCFPPFLPSDLESQQSSSLKALCSSTHHRHFYRILCQTVVICACVKAELLFASFTI